MMYFNYICIMDVRFTNASTSFEGYTKTDLVIVSGRRNCVEGEMGYEGGEWFSGKILCHFEVCIMERYCPFRNVHMAENKASSL